MFGKKKNGSDIYGVKGKRPFRDESPETGFRHSDHYHRYFRGYTEVRTEKPNGGYRLKRFYTAPWQVQDCSDRAYWCGRALCVLLVALAAVLYVMALTNTAAGGNACWYVAVPGLPSAVLLVYCAGATLLWFFAPRRMTYYDRDAGATRLRIAALIAAIALALTAVMKLVYLIGNAGTPVLPELLTAAELLAAAAAIYAEGRYIRSLRYREEPNETVLPEGEQYEIR